MSKKTLLDRGRSENIRRECNVEDIMDAQTETGMEQQSGKRERVVKIAKDKSPARRSVDRLRKRWNDNLDGGTRGSY